MSQLPVLLWTLLSNLREDGCYLPPELRAEIRGYRPLVRSILSEFVAGAESGSTYADLAYFADRFGHRVVGSASLEEAIDHLVSVLRHAGMDHVAAEPVSTPVWSRGPEKATVVSPRVLEMEVLGLGGSVSTPPAGITARVLVVESFDELQRRRHEVNGTIVLFRPKWRDYKSYVVYRERGPSMAARYGAVATLVRSAAPFSLYTPHTGKLSYDEDAPRIPAAAVTVEDADFLARVVGRGEEVKVHLEMSNNHTNGTSRNVVADITGTAHPGQYVILGAHTDSWDVGQGVMDDAGGVFIAVKALSFLRKRGLRPRRTLRTVLWTSEENGLVGATEFVRRHRDEMDNVSLALESDTGTFAPYGLTTSSENNLTQCILREVLSLMAPIGATTLEWSVRGSDVDKLKAFGVPVSTLLNRNERYFHYHHTKADTMSLMSSRDLDLCTGFWAAVGYVFADLRDMLPR